MRSITIIALAFWSIILHAQEFTLPVQLVNEFLEVGSKSGSDIIVETKLGGDDFYETVVKYANQTSIFKLKPLVYPSFKVKLKDAIQQVIQSAQSIDSTIKTKTPNDQNVDSTLPMLFAQIVTYYNTEEERPVVANIYLKQDIPVYTSILNNKKSEEIELKNLIDASVEISFYGGFIEKIQVHGVIGDDNTPIVFNNKYSIGVSSVKNIQQFNENKLYSDEKFNVTSLTDLKISKNSLGNITNKDFKTLYVKMDDVIRYTRKVDVNANDISPFPQLVYLDNNQQASKLYREESSKLFEAVVYTDFFGLLDEENPNGIVQTEVVKRFNIHTKRAGINKKFGLLFPPIAISEGFGFFQYFDASFQFSKIEKNNRFLKPLVFDQITYYDPLKLYQQRVFNIGGILNIITFENQSSKLNMYGNIGFLFGRTGYSDAINPDDGKYFNNIEVPVEFYFHILPEKRISFTFGDRISWFETLVENVNIKSIENKKLELNKWYNSFNIEMNVDVSTSGKLFLRYSLISEIDNIKNNFSFLQFGYSFYLLKSNGVKKNLDRG